jgi:hypothetical protein
LARQFFGADNRVLGIREKHVLKVTQEYSENTEGLHHRSSGKVYDREQGIALSVQ